MEKRSIIIAKDVCDELKIMAVKTDKFLYELVAESIPLLKEKYEMNREEEVRDNEWFSERK